MDSEQARQRIVRFINDAKLQAFHEYQIALERIGQLPWWNVLRAKQIACKALGWGPYAPHRRLKPATLPGFWIGYVWIQLGSAYRRFKYRTGIQELQRRFFLWRYNLGKPPDKRVKY